MVYADTRDVTVQIFVMTGAVGVGQNLTLLSGILQMPLADAIRKVTLMERRTMII